MDRYLAIDVGGTFIKYSIIDEDYNELEDGSVSTKKEPEEFILQLKEICTEYKEQVKGVALCIGGFIDDVTGENTDYSVGENFRAYNLKTELEKATGFTVSIENDSNCAAIGEMVNGAAKDTDTFTLVTIGTGIGGAIVLNRQLVKGVHNKAGEAGFCVVSDDNTTGNATATSGLVASVSKYIGEKIDGKYVFDNLKNPEINKIYLDWVKKIAIVVGDMVSIIDPEKMLIGGGVSKQKIFIDDLKKAVDNMFPHLCEYTQILPCETGNLAGRIGAVYLLKKQL